MVKTHKKQHFVPAGYLKAWCDPACPPNQTPYVWIFDKDGSNSRNRAPSNIFTETDIYTIHQADGTRDLRLEKGLNELETRFSKLRISKFNFERALNDDEHIHLSAFVAAAQFRTPSSRDHHASQWGNIARLADDMVKSMSTASPERRRAAAEISGLSSGRSALTYTQVKTLAEAPLQTMMPSILRTVTPTLLKMDLMIFCTDDPIGFITSDNPCVWFDPEAYKMPPLYQSPALGSATIEVTMPVSPTQCLYFNWQGKTGYKNIPPIMLHELNRRHRFHSHKQFVVRKNSTNNHWFHVEAVPGS